MPSYDYACENGHVTTEVRSIHEETSLTECTTEGCGSTVLNRIWTPIPAVYNGTGFYTTDKHDLLKPGQKVDW